jgi:hypothetical protein
LGVQIGFTSTEISFAAASLLPLCDKYGKFKWPKRTETPATGESHERGNVSATRKARVFPFVVSHLALLALSVTL